MPSRYDEQTRAKAVRLVTEHVQDYDSEWGGDHGGRGPARDDFGDVAPLGPAAQIDAGKSEGTTTAAARETYPLSGAPLRRPETPLDTQSRSGWPARRSFTRR
jgi:transposase